MCRCCKQPCGTIKTENEFMGSCFRSVHISKTLVWCFMLKPYRIYWRSEYSNSFSENRLSKTMTQFLQLILVQIKYYFSISWGVMQVTHIFYWCTLCSNCSLILRFRQSNVVGMFQGSTGHRGGALIHINHHWHQHATVWAEGPSVASRGTIMSPNSLTNHSRH